MGGKHGRFVGQRRFYLHFSEIFQICLRFLFCHDIFQRCVSLFHRNINTLTTV